MKKIIAVLLALLMLISLTACSSGNGSQSGGTIEGDLEDIFNRMYEAADLDDETREFLAERTMFIEPDEETFPYFFFVEGVDYAEALVNEPLINAQAFSIGLVRVNDGVDVEALKKDIAANANPRKWICVEVDPSDVRVESVGNLILFIMADNSEKYAEAFLGLAS